jgi:protein gp37
MCDVFDHEAPEETRYRLFELIRHTPHLDWQLLTKRPENFSRYLPADWGNGYANVWLGSTIEDRERAAKSIPILRDTAAHIRFVSAEPLLEDLGELDLSGIQWLIAGGESGGKARPFDAAWAESLQRQCVD